MEYNITDSKRHSIYHTTLHNIASSIFPFEFNQSANLTLNNEYNLTVDVRQNIPGMKPLTFNRLNKKFGK